MSFFYKLLLITTLWSGCTRHQESRISEIRHLSDKEWQKIKAASNTFSNGTTILELKPSIIDNKKYLKFNAPLLCVEFNEYEIVESTNVGEKITTFTIVYRSKFGKEVNMCKWVYEVSIELGSMSFQSDHKYLVKLEM